MDSSYRNLYNDKQQVSFTEIESPLFGGGSRINKRNQNLQDFQQEAADRNKRFGLKIEKCSTS